MRKQKEVLIRTVKEVSEYQEVAHFTDNKVNFETIAELIFDATGWTDKATFGKVRQVEAVFRRGIIDLIANCNGITLLECAKKTWREHTTVMHSLRNIEDRLDTDMYARTTLREIMAYIRENYKQRAQS